MRRFAAVIACALTCPALAADQDDYVRPGEPAMAFIWRDIRIPIAQDMDGLNYIIELMKKRVYEGHAGQDWMVWPYADCVVAARTPLRVMSNDGRLIQVVVLSGEHEGCTGLVPSFMVKPLQ
jgi:hypothetical protein